MSSSFAFQFTLCAFIMIQVHSEVTIINGTLGGFVTLHLEYPDLERPTYTYWHKGTTFLNNLTAHMNNFRIFSNGTLALKNIQKKDEGQYTASVYNIDSRLVYQRIFQLHVHGATEWVSIVRGTIGACLVLDLHECTNMSITATWKNGNRLVAKMKSYPVKGSGTYQNRFHAFPNGSLSLCPMMLRDEGQYRAKVFDHHGRGMCHQTIQLEHGGHVMEGGNIVVGITGGTIDFPLGIQSLNDLSELTWGTKQCVKAMSNATLPTNCDTYCNKTMCLQSGSLQLKSVSKADEGVYEFTLTNTSKKSFLLSVFEPAQVPAIQIRCHPNGVGELSCEGDDKSSVSFLWMLNGQPYRTESCSGACKADGKRIILAKGTTGKFVCQINYGNSIGTSSSIKLQCDEEGLLEQPLFPYILAASGGGAVILAVLASLITCCCLRAANRSKQEFMPVPSEEEKEEGMTMSVISSEQTKSPPNGDHHEAPADPAPNPPNLENTETCQGFEEEHQVEAESEVTLAPEMVVDDNNQEFLCDSFPDPIDP